MSTTAVDRKLARELADFRRELRGMSDKDLQPLIDRIMDNPGAGTIWRKAIANEANKRILARRQA